MLTTLYARPNGPWKHPSEQPSRPFVLQYQPHPDEYTLGLQLHRTSPRRGRRRRGGSGDESRGSVVRYRRRPTYSVVGWVGVNIPLSLCVLYRRRF